MLCVLISPGCCLSRSWAGRKTRAWPWDESEDRLVCKGKNASGNVQRLRAFIRAPPSEHLPAKKFDFADRVAGCLHATMSACVYTPYMYTSYIIVYASTFRSIMLLLWCYDVLRCPSKCTSCTYYIVVLHVYTFPLVHAPSPTPTANYIRHRPSTLQRQSAAHRRKLWSNKARQNGWSRFTDNQRLDGPILLLHSNHSPITGRRREGVFNKFRVYATRLGIPRRTAYRMRKYNRE